MKRTVYVRGSARPRRSRARERWRDAPSRTCGRWRGRSLEFLRSACGCRQSRFGRGVDFGARASGRRCGHVRRGSGHESVNASARRGSATLLRMFEFVERGGSVAESVSLFCFQYSITKYALYVTTRALPTFAVSEIILPRVLYLNPLELPLHLVVGRETAHSHTPQCHTTKTTSIT